MKITDIDKTILDETTSAGAVASVSAPVGGVVSRKNNTGINALDNDANLMGGPKPKKKKKNKR